uniref:GxxExxY protein n=1 Tax=Candidatus Kentrum sp. DK TaxID=2126562 RepID=A0A450TLK1_9GAMM|nr:MAG: GxxExxY protein [Candidatus Kentron sp. DK]
MSFMLFVIFKESFSMTDIIYKDESFAILGAIFEVYREMGHGFLESVYQECLEKEGRIF